MTPAEVLRGCARFLEQVPSRWTRCAFARNRNGVSIHHDHPLAVAWSAYGVIAHLAPTPSAGFLALRVLARYLGTDGSYVSVIAWGNDPSRTCRDVVDAMRGAADEWDAGGLRPPSGDAVAGVTGAAGVGGS